MPQYGFPSSIRALSRKESPSGFSAASADGRLQPAASWKIAKPRINRRMVRGYRSKRPRTTASDRRGAITKKRPPPGAASGGPEKNERLSAVAIAAAGVAAGRAVLARPRLVDGQWAPLEIFFVKLGEGFGCIVLRLHFD